MSDHAAREIAARLWDPAGRPRYPDLRPHLEAIWARLAGHAPAGRELLEVRFRRDGDDGYMINTYAAKEDAMPDEPVNLGEVVLAFVRDKGNPSVKDICRMLQDDHQYGPAFGAAVVAGLRDRGRIVIDEAAGTVALAPGEEDGT